MAVDTDLHAEPRDFTARGSSAIIERTRNCDVPLSESDVSRRHVRIERTAAGFRLTDLDSMCGTDYGAVCFEGPVGTRNVSSRSPTRMRSPS